MQGFYFQEFKCDIKHNNRQLILLRNLVEICGNSFTGKTLVNLSGLLNGREEVFQVLTTI